MNNKMLFFGLLFVVLDACAMNETGGINNGEWAWKLSKKELAKEKSWNYRQERKLNFMVEAAMSEKASEYNKINQQLALEKEFVLGRSPNSNYFDTDTKSYRLKKIDEKIQYVESKILDLIDQASKQK